MAKRKRQSTAAADEGADAGVHSMVTRKRVSANYVEADDDGENIVVATPAPVKKKKEPMKRTRSTAALVTESEDEISGKAPQAKKKKVEVKAKSSRYFDLDEEGEISDSDDDDEMIAAAKQPLTRKKKTKSGQTKSKTTRAATQVFEVGEEEEGAPSASSTLTEGKRYNTRSGAAAIDESDELEAPSPDADGNAEATKDEYVPVYTDQWSSFDIPVEAGKDYVSKMPPEVLGEILSYLILDNDPERGARYHKAWAQWPHPKVFKFDEKPHVLLGLGSMSTHFRDNVEDFSRRHMMMHKEWYYFNTNEELEAAERERLKDLRRSERLKTLPVVVKLDTRCYRSELVSKLRYRCIICRHFSMRFSVLASAVGCHQRCEKKLFPGMVNLTDAMHKYDLKDWMLIASRTPGPRIKQIDIPKINYGTERVGMRGYHGMCISYKFLESDVKRVAEAVHGDVDAHMVEKKQARLERKNMRRKAELRKLGDQYAKEIADLAEIDEMLLNAWEDLGWPYIHDPDEDSDDNGSWEDTFDDKMTAGFVHLNFGPYSDEHRRICPLERCDHCREGKMMKYVPWW